MPRGSFFEQRDSGRGTTILIHTVGMSTDQALTAFFPARSKPIDCPLTGLNRPLVIVHRQLAGADGGGGRPCRPPLAAPEAATDGPRLHPPDPFTEDSNSAHPHGRGSHMCVVGMPRGASRREAPQERGVARHQKVDAGRLRTIWCFCRTLGHPLPAAPKSSSCPSSSETAPWPQRGDVAQQSEALKRVQVLQPQVPRERQKH